MPCHHFSNGFLYNKFCFLFYENKRCPYKKANTREKYCSQFEHPERDLRCWGARKVCYP